MEAVIGQMLDERLEDRYACQPARRQEPAAHGLPEVIESVGVIVPEALHYHARHGHVKLRENGGRCDRNWWSPIGRRDDDKGVVLLPIRHCLIPVLILVEKPGGDSGQRQSREALDRRAGPVMLDPGYRSADTELRPDGLLQPVQMRGPVIDEAVHSPADRAAIGGPVECGLTPGDAAPKRRLPC